MSVKKLAEEYIRNLSTPEMKLREVEDTSDYYCFSYFHPTEIYVGQGLIFINKLDNRFFIYGSGNSDPKTDFKIKLEQEKMARKTFPEFDIRKDYNIKINAGQVLANRFKKYNPEMRPQASQRLLRHPSSASSAFHSESPSILLEHCFHKSSTAQR